jgi:hypothetical protein
MIAVFAMSAARVCAQSDARAIAAPVDAAHEASGAMEAVFRHLGYVRSA